MEDDFRVLVHRNTDSLHVVMEGKLDGQAAKKVLDCVHANCVGTRRVFLHTSSLSEVYPDGLALLTKNMAGGRIDGKGLVFTGHYGAEMAVPGSMVL